MLESIACGGLAASLLVFLLSTRQFPLAVRAAIWLAGVLILIGAAICATAWKGHFGLLQMLGDALQGGDLIARAAPRDLPSMAGALAPLIDVFLPFAGLLGVISLVAFTPGEAVEKLVRPLMIAMIGAIGGAFLALLIVASGLAGDLNRRVYIQPAEAISVYDGDTIRMDDMSLRLTGIDAPERTQSCITYDKLTKPCGEEARRNLQRLIQGAVLVCDPPPAVQVGQEPAESFGRPIMRCFAKNKDGRQTDLSKQMIEDGYAAPFPEGAPDDYAQAFTRAQGERKGMFDTCTLAPWVWRNDAAARRLFEAENPTLLSGAATMGYCAFFAAGSATSPETAP